MGQKVVHWMRFLVRMGRMMTSPRNRETKTVVLKKMVKEVISSYSVTVLNGHSQSQ